MFTLRIQHKGKPEREFDFSRGTLTIGRRVESDLYLEDITVSGRHAQLETLHGPTTIKDLGSTNGTYVNGKRIGKTELADGDQIRIGTYQITYHITEQGVQASEAPSAAEGGTESDMLTRLRSATGLFFIDIPFTPDELEWVAQDAEGVWWAFDKQPEPGKQSWTPNSSGIFLRLGRGTPDKDWQNTLKRL